jgi:LPXTG-motif cell wall-anchored protein
MKQSLRDLQTVLSVAAIALAVTTLAPRAKADDYNKRTLLTVKQTIQIKDTVLEPGQYVLQLQESDSDRHIVELFNRDRTHILGTYITLPRYRVHDPDKSTFTFWETPPGTAKALRAWYYPGNGMGEEFPYPNTHHMLASAETPAPAPAPSAAVTPAPALPAAAPAPEAAMPEVTQPEAPAPAETPAPSAAPAPEPAPNPPAQADTQANQAAPAELPKTGSRYPLFGIAGVSLLALAGLLRTRRTV